MHKVKEVSLADTARLFDYLQCGVFGAKFKLKGFEYAWTIRAREWKPGERVLDVGAGYSALPSYLADTFGCEVWAVDDFGMSAQQDFWKRARDPHKFVEQTQQVKYILERLGDPDESSLPLEYFDVICSSSALEHVPDQVIQSVWRHMDLLLKPGGEMLHAIDLKFQGDRGFSYLLLAGILDLFYRWFPSKWKSRYARATPRCYVYMIADILGFDKVPSMHGMNSIEMVLDPEILIEPPETTYNRIIKDNAIDIRYHRTAALLLHLIKAS